MTVVSRKSDLLRRLESLLDHKEQDIPPRIYEELEGIYNELNEEIPEIEGELEEARSRIIELGEQVEELESNGNDG